MIYLDFLSCATLGHVLLPVLGWVTSNAPMQLRPLLFAFTIFGTVTLPLLIPPHLSSSRWWMSILCFGELIKIVGLISDGRRLSLRQSAWYFLIPMGSIGGPLDHQKAQNQTQVKRFFVGCLKLGVVLSYAILYTILPELHSWYWITMFNAIVISYFMISGTIDIHSAIIGALFGVYIPDFCDAPLRSTSPRDFWSRRWNLLFRHVMHKSIFTELRRKGYNPIIGALLVCFASALLHEYMVWISCDGKPGWMTLFFVIHTTATIFETLLAKTLDPYMAHVPNIVKTAMFAMLMAMTAPLFMEPAQQCIPFMRWRLW